MLEIIIMIGVIRAFARTAGEKNLNKTMWGIIGGVSYYGPILLMSFVLIPMAILRGWWAPESEMSAMVIAVILNLIVGVACCFFAYQYLKNAKPNIIQSDILDEEIEP